MNLSAITLRLEPQHLGLKINVNRLGHRGFGGQEAKIGLPWRGSPSVRLGRSLEVGPATFARRK
jgi:hypothetical protein